MRAGPGILALLLLAPLAGRAEEQPGAPLESSKQALKALQSEQAARNVPAGKATDGLPQIQAPVPGLQALDFAPPEKPERDLKKKKEQQKNWLLDGMDKLESNSRSKGKAAGNSDKAGETDENEEKPDSSDPDYMLKLYAEQKKQADAKAEARQAATVHPDPLAPFLQGWMGTNSPARGRFFDEFASKPVAGADRTGPGAPTDFGPGQVTSSLALVDDSRKLPASPQAASNPYLQGLTDVGPQPGLDSTRAGQPDGASSMFGLPASPAGSVPSAALPPPQAVEKKPAFLAPSDNDKYFPQLKRF